jgi:HEPN pEK499 p136
MMNEFYSMSKEKAFITKTLMLTEQYDELVADKPASVKLEMTLRLNCLLGLLIIPQQKLNNSKMIRVGSKDLWGVEIEEIEFFPHPGMRHTARNEANSIAFHLRNSLAHNNFYVSSTDGENITHILFEDFSRNSKTDCTFRHKFSVENLMKFVNQYYSEVVKRLE